LPRRLQQARKVVESVNECNGDISTVTNSATDVILGVGVGQPKHSIMTAFRWFLFPLLALSTVAAQQSGKQPVPIPEEVAALVRPILDLRQQSTTDCGQAGERETCRTGIGFEREKKRWWNIGKGIGGLASQKTAAADEALVVLMCYYTGESGDNEDAVINRGRRELPYFHKYWKSDPVIPKRQYSDSIRLRRDAKEESFRTAVSAIRKGEKRD